MRVFPSLKLSLTNENLISKNMEESIRTICQCKKKARDPQGPPGRITKHDYTKQEEMGKLEKREWWILLKETKLESVTDVNLC